MAVPVAARSKTWVCGLSIPRPAINIVKPETNNKKNIQPINDFKSVCRIQNKLTKGPPTNLKETQTTPKPNPNLNNTGKTRRRPYPPNFNNTPL
jgi:hypothetical protein